MARLRRSGLSPRLAAICGQRGRDDGLIERLHEEDAGANERDENPKSRLLLRAIDRLRPVLDARLLQPLLLYLLSTPAETSMAREDADGKAPHSCAARRSATPTKFPFATAADAHSAFFAGSAEAPVAESAPAAYAQRATLQSRISSSRAMPRLIAEARRTRRTDFRAKRILVFSVPPWRNEFYFRWNVADANEEAPLPAERALNTRGCFV